MTSSSFCLNEVYFFETQLNLVGLVFGLCNLVSASLYLSPKSTMRYFLAIALFLLLSSCGQQEDAKEDSTTKAPKAFKPKPKLVTQYVFAKSGLNLREEADLKSKVIKRLPLNTKVEVHTYDFGSGKMVIEGLEGKMIKVKAGNIQGYVFSGFLTAYPVPKKADFGAYANKLQLDEQFPLKVNYRSWETAETDSSFLKFDEVLTFSEVDNSRDNWQQFFLIAQKLGFMNHEKFTFAFPGPEQETLINLTDKRSIEYQSREKNGAGNWKATYFIDVQDDFLWSIGVEITKDASNNLVSIAESVRMEGSGATTTLKWNDDETFTIAKTAYAD